MLGIVLHTHTRNHKQIQSGWVSALKVSKRPGDQVQYTAQNILELLQSKKKAYDLWPPINQPPFSCPWWPSLQIGGMGGISKMALEEGCSKISKSEVAIAAMRWSQISDETSIFTSRIEQQLDLLKIERWRWRPTSDLTWKTKSLRCRKFQHLEPWVSAVVEKTTVKWQVKRALAALEPETILWYMHVLCIVYIFYIASIYDQRKFSWETSELRGTVIFNIHSHHHVNHIIMSNVNHPSSSSCGMKQFGRVWIHSWKRSRGRNPLVLFG